MSSRYPASDDFEDNGLPDLPGGLFDDDEDFYPRKQRGGSRNQPRRDPEEWEDEPQDRREHPRRRARREEDPVREERPRQRPRPRRDDDYEMGARRQAVSPGEDYVRREYPAGDSPMPRRRRQVEAPARRREGRPLGPSRHDRVIEQPRMQAQAIPGDVVTNIRPARAGQPARQRRPRNPAWSWKPIVMPQPRQMMEQAWPNLLMAMTAVGILLLMPYMPFGLPLWAPLLMLPTILLYLFSDKNVHPMWARAALVNLATVGAFFPLVIVRQSVLRVPFVEWGNGTLLMPVLTTIGTVLVLVTVALAAALLCEEDPEYAGIIFLPAALLVPIFAGATEITNLRTAFIVLAAIYIASSVLTITASMLPGAYPTLVAPVALAIEFLVLPLAESTPIFPVGAGMSAKLLFFILLFVAVGLTVFVPMIAVWLRQVRRYVEMGGMRDAAGVA